jgi:hypothetical protein
MVFRVLGIAEVMCTGGAFGAMDGGRCRGKERDGQGAGWA